MRNISRLSLLVLFLHIAIISIAQKEEKTSYKEYFEKGSKAIGLQIGVAGGYPVNSYTILDISKTSKDYGLLAVPSFGWFLERNFQAGIQMFAGFNHYSYSNFYSNPSVSPPVVNEYKIISKGFDIGAAPFVRYYVPLGKRNVVSLFGQGSLPIIYSKYKEEIPAALQNSGWYINNNYNQEEVKVIASLGLGVSINGKYGSLEINGNNTGLYIGVQKYLFAKKK